MIVDRYYYDQLNGPEKEIYKALYKGVMEHKDYIPAKKNWKLTEELLHKIFNAITSDNPLIYFLNHSAINLARDAKGNSAILPQYFFSVETIAAYNKRIQDSVNHLVAQLNLIEGSDYEKELKVHDYICRNISYDSEGTNLQDFGRVIASHNIIGVFAHRRAQCEGIAKAIKVLLNAVDVRCIVVNGKALTDSGQWEEHAWNMINLGGVPYHMDVTWDIGASWENWVAYDYFNLSDALIKLHHLPYEKLPECTSEDLNYFRINHLVFTTKFMLKAYIAKSIKQRQTTLYFRLAGNLQVGKVAPEIQEMAEELFLEDKEDGWSGRTSRMVNEKMNTCRITFR